MIVYESVAGAVRGRHHSRILVVLVQGADRLCHCPLARLGPRRAFQEPERRFIPGTAERLQASDGFREAH